MKNKTKKDSKKKNTKKDSKKNTNKNSKKKNDFNHDFREEILAYFRQHIETIIEEEKKAKTNEEKAKCRYRLTANQRVYNIISKLPKITELEDCERIEGIGKHSLEKIKKIIDGEVKIPKNKLKIHSSKISRRDIDHFKTKLNHTNIGPVKFYICGSYRRGALFSGDIDVLIYSTKFVNDETEDTLNLLTNFVKALKKNGLITKNITSPESGLVYRGYCPYGRIDIKLVPIISLPTALLYFTGSKAFNLKMRKKAKDLGYKLSEYGLFKGSKRMDVKSERDVFKILNMDYLAPSERE